MLHMHLPHNPVLPMAAFCGNWEIMEGSVNLKFAKILCTHFILFTRQIGWAQMRSSRGNSIDDCRMQFHPIGGYAFNRLAGLLTTTPTTVH